MKRKYLSALLMGTLIVASTSTFTSCKDYDDDISSLQEQIDKLATADQLQSKVDEMKALISANSTTIATIQDGVKKAQDAAAAAQSTADKKATLDEVKTLLADYATKQYVDDANATLDAAIKALQTKDIAELKTLVEKAQASADQAAKDAAAAKSDILETLKNYATKAEVSEVQDAANKAIAAVEANNTEALKKAQAEILETLKDYATKEDLAEVANNADKALKAAQAAQTAKDEAAKEAADKALNDAVEKLNASIKTAQDTANEAKKTAGDNAKAIEALAETTSTANAAKEQADANKTAIENAVKLLGNGFSEQNTVAAALQAITAQIGTPNKELGTLDSRLSAIESALNGVKDDDTKLGLSTKISNIETQLKTIIGEYTTMVTEVSLVGCYGDNEIFNSNLDLQFMSDKVAQDLVFGKDQKDDTGKAVKDAEGQVTYVKGADFNNETAIVVRVNPTNAQITKDMIKLVDSQGNDLDDVLEIEKVGQFNSVLSRAADSNKTGLWTITVKVKDGVDTDKIEQKVGGTGADKNKHKLYAVAIKNTETPKDAADRYVTSTYDVTVQKPKDFVATTNIKDVKIWSDNTMGYDNAITLNGNKKITSAANGAEVAAKNGENINIDFSAYKNQIEYFYVVRDDSHVDVESGTSAINAWNSYEYAGLGQVVKADEGGKISINIKGQVGDEIGFRIFAVNYNGTLAPATGDSFVVYVGEQQNQASVAGSIDVTKVKNNATGWLPISGTLKDGETLPSTCTAKVDGKDIEFNVEYAKDDKATRADKVSEIKYAKFTCTSDMSDWKDSEKAIFTISQKDAAGKMVENELSVTLTKVLPTEASTKKLMGYTWKDEQLVGDTYTAYVYPEGNAWTTAGEANGYKQLDQAITGLKSGFNINVANLKKDDKDKYTVAEDFTAAPWKVSVDNALIDGTTKHATKIGYNYGKISSETKDADGNIADYIVTVETVQTIFACPLDKGVQTYKWVQFNKKDVNYLIYGSNETVPSKYDSQGNPTEHVNLFDYIIGHNDFDNTVFGGTLSALATSKYVSVDAKLISNVSKQEDYYTTTVNNGVISFTSKSGTTNPVKNVASTLVITVKDAFGHTNVYEMPFTVKRAE